MKNSSIIFSLLLILTIAGCTSDGTTAGQESTVNIPAAAPAASSGNQEQPAGQADPAANGGSDLPVSAPYQGSGAPVSQNVNPGPFLTATTGAAASTQAASSGKARKAQPRPPR